MTDIPVEDYAQLVEESLSFIQDFQQPLLDRTSHHFLKLFTVPEKGPVIVTGFTYNLETYYPYLEAKYGLLADAEMDSIELNLTVGLVACNVYSAAQPGGRLGDVHVATCLPISEEDYRLFREQRWNLVRAMRDPATKVLIKKWTDEVHLQ